MNQDQVKAFLLRLEPQVPEFSVIFTGKESRKVDGLYKPETQEILLHNRNYKTDSRLIYTAIHEFAHHVHFSSPQRPQTTRAHTTLFYSIFHKLLIKAEEMGLYQAPDRSSPEIQNLAQRIKEEILGVHGQAMVRLGEYLKQAFELCREQGVNYEDFLDRVLALDRRTAKWAVTLAQIPMETSVGVDNMKILSRIRDPQERQEAQENLLRGASPDMIKSQFLQNETKPGALLSLDPKERLLTQKERLEKTIQKLRGELEAVEKELKNISYGESV